MAINRFHPFFIVLRNTTKIFTLNLVNTAFLAKVHLIQVYDDI